MTALPRLLALCLTLLAPGLQAQSLPLSVSLALRQAQVPASALGLWVQALDEDQPRLQWQAGLTLNPASLVKLITTFAALDQVGPAWRWATPVWLNGRLSEDGVLDGDLVIKGMGDPRLTQERLWLLLRRLQQQYGLREIRGHIVIDRSAFAPTETLPGDFDGEAWRPANVQADALLLNQKTLSYSFRPDPQRRLAWVTAEPALGLAAPASVPLSAGTCDDWRGSLKLEWIEGQRPRFAGSYPAACPEQQWTLADPEPASYNARLLASSWRELGGRLQGAVLEGRAPAGPPTLLLDSPPLAELLRDINKSSNNVMAQHLLLSLARGPEGGSGGPVSAAAAAEWLRLWLQRRVGDEPPMRLINGSGLARETRLSAQQLALLLRQAFESPRMPEFVASLPLAGVDGTLSRQPARFGAALGRAHLKTGSLRDVVALAGYVQSVSNKRYVLVAIINDPLAPAARPALDALLRWVAQDAPPAQMGARP